MKRIHLAYLLFILLVFVGSSHTTIQAETRCGPDSDSLRITLNTQFGCVTENLFKKQIEVPSDLNTPRVETAPDTGRRIKSLSEWRQAKPAQPVITESPK